MSDGFESIFAGLDKLVRQVEQAAVVGLDAGASALQAEAQATDAYAGVTGATRAGTVAYVSGVGVDTASVFGQAVAEVRDRNPEHVLVETAEGGGPDELVVVLTVPSDYIQLLETGVAGEKAFIGPTMTKQAPALLNAAGRSIGEVFR